MHIAVFNIIKKTFVHFQVLTDQSEWAVCGRSAGVVNMDTARKQTVVVEVMALVGGHLPLPKVKLSKYIPADMNSLHKPATDKCSELSNQKSAATDEESNKNGKAVMNVESNDQLVAKTSSFHNSTNNGKQLSFSYITSSYRFMILLRSFDINRISE